MKACFFTFLSIILISCNSLSGNAYREHRSNSRDSTIIAADTVPKYLITTNGRSNSVQITSDNQKTPDPKQQKKNKIEINGESNSVNITENGSNGTIEIKQAGKQNTINITQTR